jgi:glycosyltransferase involved in cell wall biosynthesis
MSCGAQIIATDYSGHTEYLNRANSYLLDVNGMQPAQDGKWFHGQGEWCTFDTNQLVETMRAVHDQKQTGRFSVSDDSLRDTVAKYSWVNTVREIEKALS